MFNFKKIKEAVTKLTSIVLTAILSVGMFSATPIKAMTGFDKNIVLVGNAKSGKTKIIDRMLHDKFEENYIATMADFFIIFNNNQYSVRIWDTSGQKKYYGFIKAYIRSNDAIILAVAYDNENWENDIGAWLVTINNVVSGGECIKKLKVVLTKSDLQNKKFKKKDVEEYLNNNKKTYKNLNIENTVIETSAKNDIGIRRKSNEGSNPKTCLEDYLLSFCDKNEQSSNAEDKKQVHSSTKQPEINSFGKNNNEGQSIFQKSKGFVKKHPVISCTIGTLVTGIVVTPLVIFRNKIIKGIESTFGKNQNKKPIAKKIKVAN